MINPSWYPSDKQLRQFAAICLPGFGLIGTACHYGWGFFPVSSTAANTFWILAVGAFLIGIARPTAIRPLYTVMMAVTLPIGWLISAIFLRAIFYGLFTPIGFVFKLIGRDPLHLQKPQSASFWVKHEQRTDPMSYFRQA
jgi:hypothetical protein